MFRAYLVCGIRTMLCMCHEYDGCMPHTRSVSFLPSMLCIGSPPLGSRSGPRHPSMATTHVSHPVSMVEMASCSHQTTRRCRRVSDECAHMAVGCIYMPLMGSCIVRCAYLVSIVRGHVLTPHVCHLTPHAHISSSVVYVIHAPGPLVSSPCVVASN